MKRIVLTLIFILCTYILSAQNIHLKDGSIIIGEIIAQDSFSLTVKTSHGELNINNGEIQKIEYEKVVEIDVKESKSEVSYERNGAFIVRPLSTIIMAAAGAFDLYIEGTTAYNSWFALNTLGDISFGSSMISTAICIGPQFNLSRKYLDGFYVGIYPGFQYGYVAGYGKQSSFYLQSEIGYQKVTKQGFLFGFYTGGTFSQEGPMFKIGAKIGGAFPDPLFKIEKKK